MFGAVRCMLFAAKGRCSLDPAFFSSFLISSFVFLRGESV